MPRPGQRMAGPWVAPCCLHPLSTKKITQVTFLQRKGNICLVILVEGSTFGVRETLAAFVACGRRSRQGDPAVRCTGLLAFSGTPRHFRPPCTMDWAAGLGVSATYGSMTRRPPSRARFSYKVAPMPTNDVTVPYNSVTGGVHIFPSGNFRALNKLLTQWTSPVTITPSPLWLPPLLWVQL